MKGPKEEKTFSGGLVKPGSGRGSGSGNGGVKPGFPGTGSKYTEH